MSINRPPSQTCQTCGDSEEVRPDGLVAVMCKIAARGKPYTEDLVAIERAGVYSLVPDGRAQYPYDQRALVSKHRPSLPDQPCQVCGRPAPGDVFVCAGCMDVYHGHLAAIPEIIADLEVELTRQSRKTAGPGGRHHEQPIPFGVAASDLLHELRTTLATSCRALALMPEDLPDDTVPAMLAWLVRAETSIPLRGEGPDITAEVAGWVRRARRLCDTPAERRLVGYCPCSDPMIPLRATSHQEFTRCEACETAWRVTERQDQLNEDMRDQLVTVREIAGLLRIPESRVGNWVTRGRLVRQGTLGRCALHRFGDALALHEAAQAHAA